MCCILYAPSKYTPVDMIENISRPVDFLLNLMGSILGVKEKNLLPLL